MNFIRAYPVRSFFAALMTTTASGLAYAGTDIGIVRPDSALQQIKYDAVGFEAALENSERDLHYPLADRVSIDASVDAPDLQLQSFGVSVDGAPPVQQIYSHDEALAFRSGGLQRVLTLATAPGTHRLQVSFSAMANSGSSLEPVISGRFDQSFDKPAGRPLTLELALVRDDGRSAPALRRRSWEDAPGSEGDPRARESVYLAAARHYLFAAATNLAVAGTPAATTGLLPLASALLDYGSRAQAEAILAQIAPAGEMAPQFSEAQLRLATADYRSGDLDAAAARLSQFRSQAPAAQKAAWNALYVNTLLARGEYRDAIPLLRAADSDDHLASPLGHYNLAVALLNEGQTSKGRSLLDDIGTMTADTEELRCLRDQADVVLGYDYLRRKQGGPAASMFERVRLDGPYVSRALLGLGWARYSQHGHMPNEHWGADKRGKAPDDIAITAQIELPNFSGERLADIQRALVPWMQLRGRDPLDPAVQEALLAIPYALQKAGDAQQAGTYYAEAIATLQKTSDSLDLAIGDVRNAGLFDDLVRTSPLDDSGWLWQLGALPATRSSWLLRPLIASNGFHVALRDYRDAQFLQSMTDRWKQRLTGLKGTGGGAAAAAGLAVRLDDLSKRIAGAVTARREHLIALATQELLAQKKTTQTYQLQARIALSRVYDSPTAEDAR